CGSLFGALAAIFFVFWSSPTVVTQDRESAGSISGSSPKYRWSWRSMVHTPTLLALVMEWAVIAATAVMALKWWSPAVVAAAMIVIATRQHALMVLYHDGVHGLVAHD